MLECEGSLSLSNGTDPDMTEEVVASGSVRVPRQRFEPPTAIATKYRVGEREGMLATCPSVVAGCGVYRKLVSRAENEWDRERARLGNAAPSASLTLFKKKTSQMHEYEEGYLRYESLQREGCNDERALCLSHRSMCRYPG